jgi:hypothetical protein
VKAAPILNWCIGKTYEEVFSYFTKKGYKTYMLNANNVPGNSKFKREVLDPDVYPGRVVQVIDCGLQNQRPFKGQEKPPAHELIVTYELSDQFMHDEEGEEIPDKPRWLSENFPLHNLLAEKAKSTARYNAFDPEHVYQGDFSQVLNAPVNITVVVEDGSGKNAGKKFEKVAGVSPMSAKKAEKLPKLINEPKFFDLDNPDVKVFNSLPKWIQEKIKSNLNFNGSPLQKLLGEQVKEEAKPAPEPTGQDERPF